MSIAKHHRALLLSALLTALSSTMPSFAAAQGASSIEVSGSPSTPGTPLSPAEAAIERAIAELELELAGLEADWRAEAQSLEEDLSRRSDEVTRLAAEELALRRRFEELGDRLYDADQARIEAQQALEDSRGGFEALWAELARQSNELRDRFGNSLLASEHADLLDPVRGILVPEDLDQGDLDGDLRSLLSVYDRVLDAAETVSTFEIPIAHTASGGVIEEGTVLRLGLFGAYYSTPLPAGRESGFLSSPVEVGATPEGKALGLTPEQQAAIAALVASPASGGFVPADVTGGASLAALEVTDSFLEWFEKGGVFMWPIAIVAGLALLMVLERAIVLLLRTRGIERSVRGIVRLIEQGEVAAALRESQRIGGPAGRVLESALVHADRDRAVMEDAVQEALLHAQPQLTTRLSFIALCAAVAPLMGLLGTVTGMIETFTQVTIFGTSDPRNMAGGISVALITTQAGLYLAIPCLLSRGILGSFAESALGKIETGAMSAVLGILESREDGGEEPPSAPPSVFEDTPVAASDPNPTGPSDEVEGSAAMQGGEDAEFGDFDELDELERLTVGGGGR
ncbi:MAG: MotA/TolQ/ExbB proton channel family protein [Planctomycetota bacterium]|jgi:biopolymer transport protein ExbB